MSNQPVIRPGEGWPVLSMIMRRRPGVAGSHVLLEDLASQLQRYIAELPDQVRVEISQPNTGQYRFVGGVERRNHDHLRIVGAAISEVEEAIGHLDMAVELLVDRWSTWPAPAEAG